MSVLFRVQECHVYSVPPRKSNAGYRASEWGDISKPLQPLWSGRLCVMELEDRCEIRLEDGSTGELFAACPYDISGKSVDAVLDSSRYFVLRVESEDEDGNKRHAYIGVGFIERSESFDFTVALQDWTRRQKSSQVASREDDQAAQPSPHIPAGARRDFSLQDGETMRIQIHGKSAGPTVPKAQDKPALGFVLPPPPPGRRPA